MTSRPELRLVDVDTGEVLHHSEVEVLQNQLDELSRKYLGVLGENGRLRKQVAELRGLEPEAEAIRDVLEYTRERIDKPRQHIVEGGERWEKCRARLKDRLDGRESRTPDELKLAVDGALLDPWLNGSAPKAPKDRRYLDAKTIFKSPEQVERLIDLAIGFKAHAGVHLRDLIDIADELGVINWRFLLRTCECGHKRIEHSRANHEGLEGCFFCECEDFYQDAIEQLNEAKWAKTPTAPT